MKTEKICISVKDIPSLCVIHARVINILQNKF